MARHARGVAPRVNFSELFGNRDFAVLWSSGLQSTIGDQLGRVALSILVFTRTGSGFDTAATYALTFLPAVIGGVMLTGLADTMPRRRLLVSCDAIRAILFAVMAVPHLPLLALGALLILAVLVGSPFNAAQSALVADIFVGDDYVAANGLLTATGQAAQLLGFAVGGAVVALAGSHISLFIDALSFAVSSLALRAGLTQRPAAGAHGQGSGIDLIRSGLVTIAGNRQLRLLLGLAWLAGFWVVPEGLAAPYAHAHGGGPASVGILLAANPVGNLIGVVVLTRWLPSADRPRLLGLLAIGSGLPLVLCGWGPGIAGAALLWGACGLFSAYLVLVVTEFVAVVPPASRGQAIGVASSGLLAAQGSGLLLGGLIASVWAVAPAIAVCGAAGSLLAVPMSLARRRDAARSDG